MFAKSIRLRFQLWLAFLLVAILSGFGFTAFQLYRTSRFSQIDNELQKRVASLSSDLRSGGPFGPGGPGGRGHRDGRDGTFFENELGGRRSGPGGRGFGPPPDDMFGPPDREGFHGPGPRGFGPRGGEFRGGDFKGPPELRDFKMTARTTAFFADSDTNSFYFAMWTPFGEIFKRSSNAPPVLAQPPKPGRDTTLQFQMHGNFREAFQYTERGHAILVGHSIADLKSDSRRFAIVLLAAGGAILGLGLGGGWILATRALRPVQDISVAASRISAGNLSERINVEDTDSELGQLANLLNTTFGRLDAAFAQQKQFTADAAHELRTPLAVLISETQTALARPRTAEEYRETVEACLETAQRMRGLTHSLLELARFDAGQEHIEKTSFDLAALTHECVEHLRPLARERNVQLTADLQRATITGDPQRIGQVITNLLSNAIHYNKESGQVRISLQNSTLTIVDTGQGISEADLPHIFERFYRADRSRSRANGRSGLGLAISKAILDAHHAKIEVTSQLGEGATFTIHFPQNES